MKKLRAVQDRQGHSSIPNDLRGVGQSPLLADLPPCPYLIVDGIEEKAIHPLQEKFEVRIGYQGHTIVLESAVTESHKHQGLRLWYAARYLLAHHPGVRLQLGERLLLRDTLQANIDQTTFTHPADVRRLPVEIQLHQPGTLSVSPLHQLMLVQVGYPLEALDQELILNHGDPLFKHEVKTATSLSAAS